MNYYPFWGFWVYEEKIWKKALGEKFLSEEIKEHEKETLESIEEELEEKIEKSRKTKKDLLKEASEFSSKKSGYKKKFKSMKERIDCESQKAKIKKIEDYSCQIDSYFIEYKTKKGKIRRYVEAAHIIPKHKGGDESLKNIIILCPNCHKKLDKNVITIDVGEKEVRENGILIKLDHDSHLFS